MMMKIMIKFSHKEAVVYSSLPRFYLTCPNRVQSSSLSICMTDAYTASWDIKVYTISLCMTDVYLYIPRSCIYIRQSCKCTMMAIAGDGDKPNIGTGNYKVQLPRVNILIMIFIII